MRADGSDAPGRRLTTNPFPDVNPEVSPDGQTVTFDRDSGVFAVDIDGTDVRELVSPNALVVIKHDWAPDEPHRVHLALRLQPEPERVRDRPGRLGSSDADVGDREARSVRRHLFAERAEDRHPGWRTSTASASGSSRCDSTAATER